MTKFVFDQAEGLRGLMSRETGPISRIVTIAGGMKGIGKTTIAVNLAAVWAKRGKRVLLIDENGYPDNISARLGLKTRFDLLHAINQDRRLDQVVLHGAENIFVLSALRGIHALPGLSAMEQSRLVKSFRQYTESIDVILIDTAMGDGTHVLPLSLASEQVLIVISGSAVSLTGAYALIKMMSQDYAKQNFLVFINKVESAHMAYAVFENFLRVVHQYLSVSLEMAGYAQLDKKISQANRMCQPVINLFSSSSIASSFRQLADNVVLSPCMEPFKGEINDFMQRLIYTSHLSMTNFTI
ncbi:MAG: AAA family ATPase [Nitrosomonas sp.]|nr:AAA family ATPase [Nitrosomonas sp.]MCW5606638.1 AAA family ATPase [Nitrosomonas sp.]